MKIFHQPGVMENIVSEEDQLSSHTLIINPQMKKSIIILYTIFPTHHRVILIVLIITPIPQFSGSTQTNIPIHNLVISQTQLLMKVQSTMKIIIINKMELKSNISTKMVRLSCMDNLLKTFCKQFYDLITLIVKFVTF